MNYTLLNQKIRERGLSVLDAAEAAGVNPSKLISSGEFRASEIVSLSRMLQLTRQERDKIFSLE